MAQKTRLSAIRKKLKTEKKVAVAELSREYGVTEETIRRDLEKLEQEGFANRTYGGAVLNVGNMAEKVSYVRRAEKNKEEKAIIGRLASVAIPEKATIATDASTTVMEALREMKDRTGITVLTNSVQTIYELENPSLNLIITGGRYNPSTGSLQGTITRSVMEGYYVDIVLLSCKALDLDGGFMDTNVEEAEVKRVMVEHGKKVIMCVDHTKFNKIAFTRLLAIQEVDTLITDRKPDDEWLETFKQKNVEVIYP